MMYLKDDRVRATWRFSGMAERDDGLVVSRHDLAAAVPFINENRIAHLEITLGDPLIYVDRAYFEAHQQRVMNGEVQAATDHDVDLTPLRSCPQLVSLVLEGNLLHSEVLAELHALRCLSVDNTLGKSRVDLRPFRFIRCMSRSLAETCAASNGSVPLQSLLSGIISQRAGI